MADGECVQDEAIVVEAKGMVGYNWLPSGQLVCRVLRDGTLTLFMDIFLELSGALVEGVIIIFLIYITRSKLR